MTWTIGQRLAEARRHAGIKQRQVAEHLGITSQAVSQWEAGHTRPDSNRLARLARFFGIRLEWLLEEKGPMAHRGAMPLAEPREGATVPVIDGARAGDWTKPEDAAQLSPSGECLQTDLGLGIDAFAFMVQSRSMAPEFQPGDKVIIDPEVEPKPGDFVMAKRDSDDEATFKKYRLKHAADDGDDVVELMPLNPDWPALMIDADNPGRILGTMVEHRRYRRG